MKKTKKYPRPTRKSPLCQCGGELVTEHDTRGHLADKHDVFRVHCNRCPMSSRWLSHEYDCLCEIVNGMGLRFDRALKPTWKDPRAWSSKESIEHLENCPGCRVCDELMEFFMACDECGKWGSKQSGCWIALKDGRVVCGEGCVHERELLE